MAGGGAARACGMNSGQTLLLGQQQWTQTRQVSFCLRMVESRWVGVS
jgi:hypothetical protein